MFDLEIVVDARLPQHGLCVSLDGDDLTVTVSPKVEARVLASLSREIAELVAEAVSSPPPDVPGREEAIR